MKVWRIVLLCLLAVAIFEGVILWKGRNDGFSVDRIQSKLPNNPAWEISPTATKLAQVNQILSQPYYYLGHGFQFYAFESSDGRYVLKFMRHQRLHPPVLYDWFPDCALIRDIKAKKSLKRQRRVDELFNSLFIAYNEIPEECGLIYVHLNKSENLHKNAFLVDLQGDEYLVPLDSTEFVLQERAEFVKPTIKALMKAGRIDEAKERVEQLFTLLKQTAERGILDLDGALISKNNVGFIENRAIYIDTGRFVHRESIKTKERFATDLKRLKPLYRWLVRHYPPLAAHFEKQEALYKNEA